jgi:predicted membrane protein
MSGNITGNQSATTTTNYLQKHGSTAVFYITGAIFVSLFITAFVRMSSFLGQKDDWASIQAKMGEILGWILGGTIIFAIFTFLYIRQQNNIDLTITFIAIFSCISLGLSYGALVVASLSR